MYHKKDNMKIAALDLGDVWTGTAISDDLGITARPYETIKTEVITTFLKNFIAQEQIDTIVVGYPKTMSGTESQQTKKIIAQKELLQEEFPTVTWVLWDERLSSKQAAHVKKNKSKQDKIASHSVAAALILTGYLLYLSQHYVPSHHA